MNRIKMKATGLLVVVMMLFTVSSCDLFEMDINKDPNNPAQAAVGLLLTNVELNASATFAGALNNSTMGLVALTTSSDDHNFTNSSWNAQWNYLYNNPLKDLDGILKATAQQRADGTPNPHYEGIAKVLKAYYSTMLVDLWGDIAYTQAFQGDATDQILAPEFTNDKGESVYNDAFALLTQAYGHFAELTPVPVTGDVIYGGNRFNWRAAAKSLELRLLVQISRQNPSKATAGINALLLEEADSVGSPTNNSYGIFIGTARNSNVPNATSNTLVPDFAFTFGRLQNPNDRHPMYSSAYAGGTPNYTYFGHQLMYEMLLNNDPRMPFYFKRQTDEVLDPNDPTDKQTIPCSQRTDCKYGYFPLSDFVAQGLYGVNADALSTGQKEFLAGFFGRDRADPSGIPNDNPIRTTVGLYPAGGLYDDGPESSALTNKGTGSGIFPMIMSWNVRLYRAEAALTLGGVSGDPETLFSQALNSQIIKVSGFSSLDSDADPIAAADRIAYRDARVAEFQSAGSNDAKLRVMLKQAWFMNFGNGYEVYNAFRRTGYPDDIQTPLQLPRQFALRLPYAQDEINLNVNTPDITYDSPTDAVFWDMLKFQF
jgi:hypothetical protein